MENGSKVGQNAVAAAAEKYLGDLSERRGTIFTNLGQNPQKLVDAAIGLNAVLTQAAKDADRP